MGQLIMGKSRKINSSALRFRQSDINRRFYNVLHEVLKGMVWYHNTIWYHMVSVNIKWYPCSKNWVVMTADDFNFPTVEEDPSG